MSPKVTAIYKTDVKNQILQAALESFSKTGYDKTRMDDIADKSGLSKGTLYLYFKSKEDLFNGICEAQIEQLRATLAEISRSEGDLTDTIASVYDKLRKMETGFEAVIFEMLAESTRNSRLREIFQSQQNEVLSAVTEVLRNLAKRGDLAKDTDFEALATGYIALYRGLSIGFPDSLARRAWNATTRAIIRGTKGSLLR
ncbi:MAG: TetR/AcrR family transcriptional regulator [Candidatus Bathyarchaeia archaeon]